MDWQPRTFVLSSGTQTLKWSYSKSKDLTAGEDRAWVDEVQFIPSASLLALAPTPAAESVVVNIMATVNGILLTWPVQPATQYRVFFKERWDEEWQELSADISISDGNASAVDQSTAPQRFYRIVAQ